MEKLLQKPFPEHCLPEKIHQAVLSITDDTRAPLELVISGVLSGASMATQSGYDVQFRPMSTSPLSLFFISIAQSGERKTSIDQHVFREFRAQAATNSENSPLSNLMYSNFSPYSLIKGLHSKCGSAVLLNDEAAEIFEGPVMKNLPLLNKAWSGSHIRFDRRNMTLTIRSPRLTVSWMIQPGVFNSSIKKKLNKLKDIGFMGRFLICHPNSTQGTRFIDENHEPKIQGLEDYNIRIRELLEEQQEYLIPGCQSLAKPRKILNFSPDARKELTKIINEIEKEIPNGIYADNHEFASKMAEMSARLAGIFHVFEGKPGLEISEKEIISAYDIIKWYFNEYARICRDPDPFDETEEDAKILLNYILKKMQENGFNPIPKNSVLQYGPSRLRTAIRLDEALKHLLNTHKIIISNQKNPQTGAFTSMINLTRSYAKNLKHIIPKIHELTEEQRKLCEAYT